MKFKRQRWVEILLLLGGAAAVAVNAFVGPGCGTMMNHDQRPPKIYGGVREDLRYFPVSIVDLPCSAVADTIMLPFDACSQAGSKTNAPPKK